MELRFVNLFVPTKLLKCQSGIIFGYYSQLTESQLNINITAIAINKKLDCDNVLDDKIMLLGHLIDCDDDDLNDYDLNKKFWCKLSFERNKKVDIENLIYDGLLIDKEMITIIYYDTRDFMSSQLFGTENIQDQRLDFVEFLIDTLKRTSNVFESLLYQNKVSMCFKTQDNSFCDKITNCDFVLMIPKRLTAQFIEFHYEENKPKVIKKHVRNKSWFPNQTTITNTVLNTLMMTTTGRQMRFRYNQLIQCFEIIKGMKHKRISMSAGNILLSVAMDILFGILITLILIFYSSPSHWLNVAMEQTDNLVNEVDTLLNKLMEMPVGLKLNRPLNTALGQFFLYHIYLWKTYMIIIKPLFVISVETLVFCGVFGLTCILSVLSDLVSLATIHIYCFYGYAARLYGLQALGLTALWRLFRGKKWNQLRSRVDSYSYAIDQLFIGTLSFTILLFLLPTVLMYYLVFLVLRIMTLSVQGIIRLFITNISLLPFYMIFLWFIDSKKVAGQVSFEIIDRKKETIKLRLNTNKITFGKLLKMKNDQLIEFNTNVKMSWYDLIQSIVWGKIIYPL